MNLNDMWTNTTGASDAYDAGVHRDLQNSQLEQQLQEYRLKNQQSEAMNPLLQQHQRGLNDTLNAQLSGVMGQSSSLKAKGDVDRAMVPDEIHAKRSKIYSQLDDDQLKMLKNIGEKYSQVGAYLEGVPNTTTPAGNTRMMAAQKIAQQFGLKPGTEEYDSMMEIPPEQMPQMLQHLGKTMAMQGHDFMQKRTMEQDRTGAMVANANTMAGSRTDVANIQAEARIKAAQLASQRAAQHANIEQKISQITSDPNWKTNPAAVEQYSALMKSATVLRNSAANGYQNAELLNQDNPARRADTAIEDVLGNQGAPKSSGNDLSDAAKEAFGGYDPKIYQYRMGPSGKIQRKKL